MNRLNHCAVVSASLMTLVCVSIQTAHADRADIEHHTVEPPQDFGNIAIYNDEPVFISFTNPLVEVLWPAGWKVDKRTLKQQNMIRLYARKGLNSEDIAGTVIATTGLYVYHMDVVRADSADKAPRGFVISHEGVVKREMKTAIAAIERHYADELAKKETQYIEQIENLKKHNAALTTRAAEREDTIADRAIAQGLVSSGRPRFRKIHQAPESGQGLLIRGIEWVETADRQFLRFVLENRQQGKFPVATLELRNNIGDDHAGVAVIGDRTPTDELIATLKPGETVIGTIAVRNFDHLRGSVRLIAKSPKGPNGVIQSAFRVIPVDPPIPPELTPQEKRARQTNLGVGGSLGAFWLPDGQGADRLDATSFQGLAMRLVKGINEMVAVEVELSGGFTGTARFGNMMIDGAQGELTRSASFGRAGFGGLLRFGDQVAPYLRLGIGAQLADISSQFTSGPSPDAIVIVDAMFYFGAGVGVRVGDHWLASLAASYDQSTGDTRAASVALRLSYGWDP